MRKADLGPAIPILIGASVMLSIAMGLRQSLGLFMQPAVAELSIGVADFTLAIAVQNLAWGFLQPVAGNYAARFGFRPVMIAGAALYVVAMVILATTGGILGVMLGAGVLIGVALACCAAAMAMAVASRAVPAAVRSTVLGIVSGAGSIGAMISAPIGQALMNAFDWRVAVFGFALIALAMLPAAWAAGRIDRVGLPPAQTAGDRAETAGAALRLAMGHWPFVVMSSAYFICGLQLVFLTTHLPSYLLLCGMDPMLGAQALAVIGGFNVIGSVFFGWAGGRWSKPTLLGCIYIGRSLILGWYFVMPPTPVSTLVFAAVMGFLWLGVVPLVAGITVETFGLRWQAMLQGVAFTSHQVGSFVGAFGGGLLYEAFGSYNVAWRLGVAMGLTAGAIQVLSGLPRGPRLRPAPG